MNRSQTKTLNFQNTHLFWSLVAGVAIMIFAYIYLVNITIFNTAERQRVEESIVELRSTVSQLELQLIDSNRGLTKEYANSMGFYEATELVFVEKGASASLSLNEPKP